MRALLVVLLLAIDLAVLPAMVALPAYRAGGTVAWARWRQEWLVQPHGTVSALLRDGYIRVGWLYLQPLVALPLIAMLFPVNGRRRPRKGRPTMDPTGTHGSARWRRPRELHATLRRTRVRAHQPPAGLLAGTDRGKRPRYAWIVPGPDARASVNPHALVLGGSGSGKTRRLVLPNLFLLGRSGASGSHNSIIVTDPKGELYRYTADYFRGLGYRVETLNLIDPARSSRYNPIAEIGAVIARGDRIAAAEAAWDVAHAFAAMDDDKQAHREDPFWQNAAESIIAAAVYYVAANAPEGQKNMATAYRLVTEYGRDGGGLLDMVFQEIKDLTDPARIAYGVTQLSVEKTRSSILTTAAVNLRLFADPSVAAMTAASDHSLASIAHAPTVVYLLLPDDKSARNPVAAVYLSQAYSALSHLALQSANGRVPVPVYWLLDEFANIGKFKDFDKMISVMRGRGMAAMIVIQALQQLDARYGKETAAVISSNCDTWLFLRTNDGDTARAISDKVGQFTVRAITENANFRPFEASAGTSEQVSGRHLITPDEVLRWPMGEALVLQAGQYPAKLSLSDISDWPVRFELGAAPPMRRDPPPPVPWLPLGEIGPAGGSVR